jgi:hypothetical protein
MNLFNNWNWFPLFCVINTNIAQNVRISVNGNVRVAANGDTRVTTGI